MVSAPDESHVRSIAQRAELYDLPVSVVVEPDLNDEVTAVAMAPGPIAKRLCANYPLALKESAMI